MGSETSLQLHTPRGGSQSYELMSSQEGITLEAAVAEQRCQPCDHTHQNKQSGQSIAWHAAFTDLAKPVEMPCVCVTHRFQTTQGLSVAAAANSDVAAVLGSYCGDHRLLLGAVASQSYDMMSSQEGITLEATVMAIVGGKPVSVPPQVLVLRVHLPPLAPACSHRPHKVTAAVPAHTPFRAAALEQEQRAPTGK